MKKIRFVLAVIMLVMVAGCAPAAPKGQINVPAMSIQINTPGPNPLVAKADANGQVAGALLGLWHGVIAPVTMVVSFFNQDVTMYEVHNDGSQYNLGFLLGVAIFFVVLGAIFGSTRRRR
jgi:hypothetical protein